MTDFKYLYDVGYYFRILAPLINQILSFQLSCLSLGHSMHFHYLSTHFILDDLFEIIFGNGEP